MEDLKRAKEEARLAEEMRIRVEAFFKSEAERRERLYKQQHRLQGQRAVAAAKLRAQQEDEASRGPFVLCMTFRFEGNLSEFDATSQLFFKKRLAALLEGVNVGDVGLKPYPGSIIVETRIIMPSLETALELQRTLEHMSLVQLSAALGVKLITPGVPMIEPTGPPSRCIVETVAHDLEEVVVARDVPRSGDASEAATDDVTINVDGLASNNGLGSPPPPPPRPPPPPQRSNVRASQLGLFGSIVAAGIFFGRLLDQEEHEKPQRQAQEERKPKVREKVVHKREDHLKRQEQGETAEDMEANIAQEQDRRQAEAQAAWRARPVGLGFDLRDNTQATKRLAYRERRKQEARVDLQRELRRRHAEGSLAASASVRITASTFARSCASDPSDICSSVGTTSCNSRRSSVPVDEEVIAERLAQWEERDDIRVRKEAQKAASCFRKQEPSALRGLVALWETAPLWKEGRHNSISDGSPAVASVPEVLVPTRLRNKDTSCTVDACELHASTSSAKDGKGDTSRHGSQDDEQSADYFAVHTLIDHDFEHEPRHDALPHHRHHHHATQMLLLQQSAHHQRKSHKRVLRPKMRALVHKMEEAQALAADSMGGTRDKEGYWHQREEAHLYGDELEGEHRERLDKERLAREAALARLASVQRAKDQELVLKVTKRLAGGDTGGEKPLRSCREGGPETVRGTKDVPPPTSHRHRRFRDRQRKATSDGPACTLCSVSATLSSKCAMLHPARSDVDLRQGQCNTDARKEIVAESGLGVEKLIEERAARSRKLEKSSSLALERSAVRQGKPMSTSSATSSAVAPIASAEAMTKPWLISWWPT